VPLCAQASISVSKYPDIDTIEREYSCLRHSIREYMPWVHYNGAYDAENYNGASFYKLTCAQNSKT